MDGAVIFFIGEVKID